MLEALTPEQILSHYGLASRFAFSLEQVETRILYTQEQRIPRVSRRMIATILICLTLGGILAAAFPFIRLETTYAVLSIRDQLLSRFTQETLPVIPDGQMVEFNPLVDAEGNHITPVNKDFSLIIPKIGVNAPIIAGVNPVSTAGYTEALKKGVAHASTSFYPNEDGTVYLFSHSTNYEWFVKDLNAVFYLLKNLEAGDQVVVMYLGNRYTYAIREKKVVSPREIAYLEPQAGIRTLILQTCWPPGSYWQRLLIFADLIEEKNYGSFSKEILK